MYAIVYRCKASFARVLLGRECRVSTPVNVSWATGSSQVMHLCRVCKQEAVVSGVTQQIAQVVQAIQCAMCKQVRRSISAGVCMPSQCAPVRLAGLALGDAGEGVLRGGAAGGVAALRVVVVRVCQVCAGGSV